MLKKVLVLFLCFWMSCSSVFAMNRRGVSSDDEMKEETTNEENSNEEDSDLQQRYNELLEQRNILLRELLNNQQQRPDLPRQVVDSFINGLAFGCGSLCIDKTCTLL